MQELQFKTPFFNLPKREMETQHQKWHNKQVIHPMVIVKVNGITFWALLNTGASNAYALAMPIKKINKKAVREYRNIEMIMCAATRNIKICHVLVSDVKGNHSIDVEVSKVDKPVLISLPYPNYQSLYMEYNHKDITANDKNCYLYDLCKGRQNMQV